MFPHNFQVTLLAALLSLSSVHSVNGALYVNNPLPGITCHGGEPCTVQWLDDGEKPVLAEIGPSTVGLYYGEMKLVQQISPVDVSATRSLKFTPNPKAGPNSKYYLAFESISLKGNGSDPYIAYSAPFNVDQMSGSFDFPQASLTSSIKVPPSVANPTSNSIASTQYVGGASPPPSPPTSTPPGSTGMTTSIRPTSSTTSASPGSSANAAPPKSAFHMPSVGMLILSFYFSYLY